MNWTKDSSLARTSLSSNVLRKMALALLICKTDNYNKWKALPKEFLGLCDRHVQIEFSL